MNNSIPMIRTVARTFACFALLALSTTTLMAQQEADFMRSMGKMYVVVAVIAILFIGMVLYLYSLDRKLTKLENQISHHDEAETTH